MRSDAARHVLLRGTDTRSAANLDRRPRDQAKIDRRKLGQAKVDKPKAADADAADGATPPLPPSFSAAASGH